MSIKRMSLRFNLTREADRKAWEYLQSLSTSRNKAVIEAINDSAPEAIRKLIRSTIQDCLQNVSPVSAVPAPPVISQEEDQLLSSLEDFLGG